MWLDVERSTLHGSSMSKPWVPAVLATVGGLLHSVSLTPGGAWWMQLLALALLVHAVSTASAVRAALLGWLFGVAWLTSSLWWVFISMQRYGNMPSWAATLATAALGGGLALYYAIATGGWAMIRRRVGAPPIAFAAFWLLAELARGTFFSGFPWAAGGYAHTSGPLTYWAPWVGVYGISLLSAWVAAALAYAWAARSSGTAAAARTLAAPLLVLLLGFMLPQHFTRSSGALSVTLLQPNVEQQEKFTERGIERILRWHQDALAASRGTLVVTPESSIPLASEELDSGLKNKLSAPFADGRRAALVGIFVGDEQAGYSNALVGLTDRNGLADPLGYRYGKRHLLPFGEYVPSGFDWFVAMMDIPIGQQMPGVNASSLAVANQRVRPLICYEDLFGEDFVDSVVGEAAATVLVNASNFAWFGSWRPRHLEFSQAQHQHLQVSRLRAMEFQRPVLRATNTGATTAIDHQGQVKARLPSNVEGRLEITVNGRIGATPYAVWLSRWGLWPLVALAMAGLVAAAAGSAKHGKQCRAGQPLDTAV